MFYRIMLLSLAVLILFTAGCRTGEYKGDLEIYEAMPALLEQNPDIVKNLARNEDGSLRIELEKGEMRLWMREGVDMDVSARMETTSDAFEVFHAQYMQSEKVKKENGEFYREKITLKSYVDDIELYVLEWDLKSADPNVLNNREGNFF